jgi:hypothetical protein
VEGNKDRQSKHLWTYPAITPALLVTTKVNNK